MRLFFQSTAPRSRRTCAVCGRAIRVGDFFFAGRAPIPGAPSMTETRRVHRDCAPEETLAAEARDAERVLEVLRFAVAGHDPSHVARATGEDLALVERMLRPENLRTRAAAANLRATEFERQLAVYERLDLHGSRAAALRELAGAARKRASLAASAVVAQEIRLGKRG